MLNTVHISARMTAELLSVHGVKYAVISPGSRNVPLIVALSRHPEIKTLPVIDERQAGFVALGIAVQSASPVALVCTSGTALLNYAPAVAEAFHRNVPLIVISADRPLRLIDQEDSQTIRQSGCLENIVRASFDIPSDESIREYRNFVNRLLNEALLTATESPSGPVHINIRFDTPLGELSQNTVASDDIRPIKILRPAARFEAPEIRHLAGFATGKKIMAVIGTNTPDAKLSKALKRLSSLSNVVLVHEPQSNVKGIPHSISDFDLVRRSLNQEEESISTPDIVISLGGSLVSSGLKEWLRALPRHTQHWRIGSFPDKALVDTFNHLTLNIDAQTAPLLNGLATWLGKLDGDQPNYSHFWLSKARNVSAKVESFIKNTQWGDMKAVYTFFNALSSAVNIQISNGMAIRYAAMSPFSKAHRIDCNRGCSGIDGTTATAIGASTVSNLPTVLLTGDMSLRYDIGALSLGCIPSDFAIFVISNGGGDIFRIIKTTRDLAETEDLVAMRDNTSFEQIALTFGFEYVAVTNPTELVRAVKHISPSRRQPLLVEIQTHQTDNLKIYNELLSFLKS